MRAIVVIVALTLLSCGKTQDDKPPETPAQNVKSAVPTTVTGGGNVAAVPVGEPKAKPAGGRMHVVFDDGDNKYRKAIKEEGVFQQLVDGISNGIVLPRDLPVVFTGCGQINAFYSRDKHAIIVCDEIVEYFITAIDQRSASQAEKRTAILGALVFFFLHEVGHAFVGELELPAVGREEDAADQVAALLLISAGPKGAELAGYGADAFAYILQLRGGKSAPFWDEHSLDEQRFFNTACLIYGSNPQAYAMIVDKGFLPEARAKRCPQEFQGVNAAWERLLAPYIKK